MQKYIFNNDKYAEAKLPNSKIGRFVSYFIMKSASGFVPVVMMPFMLFSGFYANQALYMDWIGWV